MSRDTNGWTRSLPAMLDKVHYIPENNKKIACGNVRIVEWDKKAGQKRINWLLTTASAVDAELFPEHCANTRLCSQ